MNTTSKIKTMQILLFLKDLSRLLQTGISLEKAIQIITNDCQSTQLKQKIKLLHEKLSQGESIQKCIQELLPTTLPAHFSTITKIPQIEIFLDHLISFLQKKMTITQELKKQLAYPMLLFITLTLLLVGFCLVIAPTYLQFFENSGLKIPVSIQILQTSIYWIESHFLWALLIITTPFLIPKTRHNVLLKTKEFVFKSNPGEIVWMLGILIKSGIPLQNSLAAIQISPSIPLAKSITRLKEVTTQSGSLYEGFCASKLISEKYQVLLLHAEQTNRLAETLIEVGTYIIDDVHNAALTKTATIQPILLAVIGLLISGFTYLSFVPILKSLQQMG